MPLFLLMLTCTIRRSTRSIWIESEGTCFLLQMQLCVMLVLGSLDRHCSHSCITRHHHVFMISTMKLQFSKSGSRICLFQQSSVRWWIYNICNYYLEKDIFNGLYDSETSGRKMGITPRRRYRCFATAENTGRCSVWSICYYQIVM